MIKTLGICLWLTDSAEKIVEIYGIESKKYIDAAEAV